MEPLGQEQVLPTRRRRVSGRARGERTRAGAENAAGTHRRRRAGSSSASARRALNACDPRRERAGQIGGGYTSPLHYHVALMVRPRARRIERALSGARSVELS